MARSERRIDRYKLHVAAYNKQPTNIYPRSRQNGERVSFLALRPRVGATLNVRVAELRLEEHDYTCLGNDDPSQLTHECLLQACIPVDWTKPVCMFEAGPRDYKRLKTDASDVLQLTIEISDSRHPDRSPWFWTGFTEVGLHFVREPPTEQQEGLFFSF